MFRLVVLSGFLGAGKTTTMLGAARALGRRGRRVAVITNDQGDDLVDTTLAAYGLPSDAVAEITGGCFCCRFEDLERTIREVVARTAADTVIAEAVGSCTDLQATVLRPLRRFYGDEIQIAPLTTLVEPVRIAALGLTPSPVHPTQNPQATVGQLGGEVMRGAAGPPGAVGPRAGGGSSGSAGSLDPHEAGRLRAGGGEGPHGVSGSDGEGPPEVAGADGEGDLAYLFERQLAEADIIALNKLDSQRAAGLEGELARRYPYALVVPCSAVTGRGMDRVLEAWEAPEPVARELEVDYDRYAAAEARLGWLNARYVVEGVEPGAWALAVLEELSRESARGGYLVGHAKVTLSTSAGLTKASLVAAGAAPVLDLAEGVGDARVAVNVRVACEPYELEALVARAVQTADAAQGSRTTPETMSAFSPSYPRPLHRLPA